MVVRLFEKHMQDMGYTVFPTKYPEIKEYIKEESSCVNIFQVVDLKPDSILDHDRLVMQTDEIKATVKDRDVHVLSLIFAEDIQMAKEIAGDEYMCRIIDRHDLSIIPEEDRVEDFYGFKSGFESWAGETAELVASGDMKAISDKLMNSSEREVYREKIKKKPSPVSVTLVIVNSLIFFTSLAIGLAAKGTNPFIASGCMDFEAVSNGEVYRLVSAMFLHGGAEHLISNMVLLYFMGEMVEHNTGSVRFAIIYMFSGILGNVISYVYELISGARYTSIGASGAVYGIMGALLFLVIVRTKNLNIPMRRMILLLAYCIYSSFATAYIDFAAHIGGLLSGFVITALLCMGRSSGKGGETEVEG